MSEKFALKWNDFQSNWSSSLSELRKETDFSDVTLISEDKVKFSAHRILLSSCSNMFKFILRENNHANPLLYLGGVSSQNIGFTLDYIYYGEVNIYQDHLDSFLESAQRLEISGLIGGNEESKSIDTKDEDSSIRDNQKMVSKTNKTSIEEELLINDDTSSSWVTTSDTDVVKQRRQYARAPPNDVTRIYVGNMTPEEIEAKTRELYQKIDDFWTCLHCGKTSGPTNIRLHVETHMDGLCYTCNICNKDFRSKIILKNHKQSSEGITIKNQINVIQIFFRNKRLMQTHISSSHKQRLAKII